MIIDAAVQTSFKSEDIELAFDDHNDFRNTKMPEEIIYLKIDTIEVNHENVDNYFETDKKSSTRSGLIYK